MLVTCSAMAGAERDFFADRDPEPWMEEAGRLCAAAVLDAFPGPARVALYVGKGNNGGDALVVGRWLKRLGWTVETHFSHGPEELSPLARKKLAELEAAHESTTPCSPGSRPLVMIDGIVGIGAKGDLRGAARKLATELNARRVAEFATTFAIDLPSGFDADTGHAGPDAVVADYTLTISAPKTGFAADEAEHHVGRLVEIPLDIPLPEGDASRRFLFPSNLRPRLPRRSFGMHKGGAGRVVITAGSPGYTGAAVLSALGASRAGAGLVTLCVPSEIYAIVAAKAPPEVIVRSCENFDEIAALPADCHAVGPGLGLAPAPGLGSFLTSVEVPVVIDADALNFLSREPTLIETLPPNRLLTPHPGEMARLIHGALTASRSDVARSFADHTGLTLLLKGARTVVASPGRPLELNTTGHPGMASGGMGDVLTGMCAALVAQGQDLHDAAGTGSWLLGRAAELARRDLRVAAESLSAEMVAEHLGNALAALQTPGSA